MTSTAHSQAINRAILRAIAKGQSHPASAIAKEFGLSKTAVEARIRKLASAGLITAEGYGRARALQLSVLERKSFTVEPSGLDEHIVYLQNILPFLQDASEEARTIWQYAFTEMLNNAIEHAGASKIDVVVQKTALSTRIMIKDDGEGIFRRIQRLANLYDARAAILELAKGKFTTDPLRHSGEGIFFSSRAVDGFFLFSHELCFSHDPQQDWLLYQEEEYTNGTLVVMDLENESQRSLTGVFSEFTEGEDSAFSKTIVPVRLAVHEGEQLISRSQARRLSARFEMFRTVLLDFSGVKIIGQGFADELFRVFASAHPNINLIPVRANTDVQMMIAHVTTPFQPDSGKQLKSERF